MESGLGYTQDVYHRPHDESSGEDCRVPHQRDGVQYPALAWFSNAQAGGSSGGDSCNRVLINHVDHPGDVPPRFLSVCLSICLCLSSTRAPISSVSCYLRSGQFLLFLVMAQIQLFVFASMNLAKVIGCPS